MEGKEDTRAGMEGKEGIRARRTQALTPDGWAETNLERKALELWGSCHRCRPTWREPIASIQPIGHHQLFGNDNRTFGPSTRRHRLAKRT